MNIYVPAGLLAYSHGLSSAFPIPLRISGIRDEKRLITAAGPRGMYAPLPFSPTKSGHRNALSTHGKVLPYSVRTAPSTSFRRVKSVSMYVVATFAPDRKALQSGAVKIHIFQGITKQCQTLRPAINILIFHEKSCDTWTRCANMPKKEAKLFCNENFLILSGGETCLSKITGPDCYGNSGSCC